MHLRLVFIDGMYLACCQSASVLLWRHTFASSWGKLKEEYACMMLCLSGARLHASRHIEFLIELLERALQLSACLPHAYEEVTKQVSSNHIAS